MAKVSSFIQQQKQRIYPTTFRRKSKRFHQICIILLLLYFASGRLDPIILQVKLKEEEDFKTLPALRHDPLAIGANRYETKRSWTTAPAAAIPSLIAANRVFLHP